MGDIISTILGIIAILVFIGVVVGLQAAAERKEELSPKNQAVKSDKQQQLRNELESLELEKIHSINTNFVNSTTGRFEKYCVGISTKTNHLVIYKPIVFSTDNLYINKIPFKNIVGCEILEDNETIQKGGVGRATVGGILAGGVGAIVGATTRPTIGVINSLKINIILSDVLNPYCQITLIESRTERNSDKYRELYQDAQEIYSTIMAIKEENRPDVEPQPKAETTSTDTTEELRKYKILLDDGIITQEEFEVKKKQLLGL